VRYGHPIRRRDDEESRAFGARINGAVATLLDEDRNDWYAARLRAASETTPAPSGPPVAHWRRVWASSASPTSRRRAKAWR